MKPPGQRKVLLFIHGYNTMFAEGLYRFVQVVDDSQSVAAPVLFTWASRGKLNQYVFDNNSATAARDALEHTIRLLFASKADQINILAHSMGNWVTVEALRQIKISGSLPQRDKLGAIILAAPDIDVDVFKSEMRRFGKPQKPFYVVLSRDDHALALSKFIAGDQNRLGGDSNINELAELGAVVIDLSRMQGADFTNHDKFAKLAEVAPQLAPILAKGIRANSTEPASQEAANDPGTLISQPLTVLGEPITIVGER
jgi:esterase/lipase superfamily enzyme